eukprot:760563-Hanusia_phi.AAC.4
MVPSFGQRLRLLLTLRHGSRRRSRSRSRSRSRNSGVMAICGRLRTDRVDANIGTWDVWSEKAWKPERKVEEGDKRTETRYMKQLVVHSACFILMHLPQGCRPWLPPIRIGGDNRAICCLSVTPGRTGNS